MANTTAEERSTFRQRVASGASVVGIFVKTSSYQIVELLGQARLDYIVIDTEHAPFDRNALDVMLLAARAVGLPVIVRIPEMTEAAVLAPLDMGATGLMIPHLRTAEQAMQAVKYARYAGSRGFSQSPRAGNYGLRTIAEHKRISDAETIVIAMIEDLEGIENMASIAAVDGIDALFIGRVDLTVTLGQTDVAHPEVETAVQRIYTAARRIKKPLGALASNPSDVSSLLKQGVRMFLVGTDQGIFRGAVLNVAAAARSAMA